MATVTESTELAEVKQPTNPALQDAIARVEMEERLFELAQRKANVYAKSSLVPKEYQGNIGNVLIAENLAKRLGADTLMVMQNLFPIHGRPSWSAQFLIATFNNCGRFTAIRYKFDGKVNMPEWGCVAYCRELDTGEVIEGTKITMAMAKAEGWSTKNGSKWLTMPEQMLRYRAATFLIRTTAPEIGMGLMTREELEDMDDAPAPVRAAPASLDALADRLMAPPGATVTKTAIEGQTEPTQQQQPADETSQVQTGSPMDKIRADIAVAETTAEVETIYNATVGPDSTLELTQDDVAEIERLRIDRKAAIRKARDEVAGVKN